MREDISVFFHRAVSLQCTQTPGVRSSHENLYTSESHDDRLPSLTTCRFFLEIITKKHITGICILSQ